MFLQSSPALELLIAPLPPRRVGYAAHWMKAVIVSHIQFSLSGVLLGLVKAIRRRSQNGCFHTDLDNPLPRIAKPKIPKSSKEQRTTSYDLREFSKEHEVNHQFTVITWNKGSGYDGKLGEA
jgi:hypothetical protein